MFLKPLDGKNGYDGQSSSGSPLITVITVVYNAVNDIEATINSVLAQDYENIEYIVIDGGSSDGTVDVVRKYSERISYWVSEKDNGIYNAMNKGVAAARGLYVNFMNAGDIFYCNSVVREVAKYADKEYGIIAGGHSVQYPSGKVVVKKCGSLKAPVKKMPFCHQSMFSRRDFLVKFPFDIEFKLAADFAFLHAVIGAGGGVKVISDIISYVSAEGVSDLRRMDVWSEYRRVLFFFIQKER